MMGWVGEVRAVGAAVASSRVWSDVVPGVLWSLPLRPPGPAWWQVPWGAPWVAEVVQGELTGGPAVGLSPAQDYPITDVCQILQKAKELQDSQ